MLPRYKAANWVGAGRGRKTTRPGANGVVELSPCDFLDRLADLVPPPQKHRHRPAGGWRWRSSLTSALAPTARGGRGHGWACRREASQGCSPRITSSGLPSRLMTKANVGKRRDAAPGGHAFGGHAAGGDTTGDRCDSCDKPPSHVTPRRQRPNSWPAWGRSSARVPGVWWRHPAQRRRPAGAGSLRTGGSQAGEGQDGFVRVKLHPDTPRRTARASARLSCPWPAHRLGRARDPEGRLLACGGMEPLQKQSDSGEKACQSVVGCEFSRSFSGKNS
jgi:hypothetical protein